MVLMYEANVECELHVGGYVKFEELRKEKI